MIRSESETIIDDSSNYATTSFYKLDWWDADFSTHKQEFSHTTNTRIRNIQLYGRYIGTTQNLTLKIYKGLISDLSPTYVATKTLSISDQSSSNPAVINFAFSQNDNIFIEKDQTYYWQLEVDTSKGTLHLSCDLAYSGTYNSTIPNFTRSLRPGFIGSAPTTTSGTSLDYFFEVLVTMGGTNELVDLSYTWPQISNDVFPIEPYKSINEMDGLPNGSSSTLKQLGVHLKLIYTNVSTYISLIQANKSFNDNEYSFKLRSDNVPQNVFNGWDRLNLTSDVSSSLIPASTWSVASVPNFTSIKYHFKLDGEKEVDKAVESTNISASLKNVLDTLSSGINAVSTKKGVGTRTFTYANYTYTINNKTHIKQEGITQFINDFKAHANVVSRRSSIDWEHLNVVNETKDLIEDETWDKLELERIQTNAETETFKNTQFDTTFSITNQDYQTSINQNNNDRSEQRMVMRERAEGRYRARGRARGRGQGQYRYQYQYTYWNTWRSSGFGRWEGWYRYVSGTTSRGRSRGVGRYRYQYQYQYQYQVAYRYRSPYRYAARVDTQRFLNTSYKKETAYWTWAVVDKQGDVDTWNVKNVVSNATLMTGTDTDFASGTNQETKETASSSDPKYRYTETDTQDGVVVSSDDTKGTWQDYPNYPSAHSWDARELYFERANVIKVNSGVIERSTSSHTVSMPLQASATAVGITWW